MANDINIDTKPIENAFKRMADSIERQKQSSYKLAEAFDKLGESGVKDLTEKIKLAAKQSKFFTDAQLKLIKTTQDLEDGIKHQEKELSKRSEAEKELRASIRETIKLLKSDTLLMQVDVDATKASLKAKLEALNQLKQEAIDKKANAAAFHAQTTALIENATSIKSWDYYLNKSKDSIKGWAASNLTARKSMEMLKTAGTQFVGELNKATAVGLQDSFFTISKEAFNLKMSFDEFSDIIAKNRDIIRQLGGGSEGISNFQTVLKDASKGLAYMGKDGTIATARFIESMKTMGITVKDTDQFGITMAATQKKFTRWSATYGDTAESFADVTESQMKSSSVQAQMIGLLPKQRDALREEIMARIENSKNLGLSNEQIKDFSDRLEHTLDPHKIDIPATIKQAASATTHLRLLAQRDPNNKVLQDAVAAMVNANEELMKNPMMGAEAFKKSVTDIQPELLQEIGKAEARTTAGTKNQAEMGANIGLGITETAGGAIYEAQMKYAGESATAYAANLNQTATAAKKAGDLAEAQVKNQSGMVTAASDIRDVMQSVSAAMKNSLVVGALAVGTALASLGIGVLKVNKALGLLATIAERTAIAGGIPTGGPGGGGGGKGGKGSKYGRMALGAAVGGGMIYAGNELGGTEKTPWSDTGSKALDWAGKGALLGALVPGLGELGISEAVGGAIGGVAGAGVGMYQNWNDFGSNKSKINPAPDVAVQAEQAAAAAEIEANQSQSQSTPTEKSNNIIEELKKHTNILEQISRNTISFKGGNSDMYKLPGGRLASNVQGPNS